MQKVANIKHDNLSFNRNIMIYCSENGNKMQISVLETEVAAAAERLRKHAVDGFPVLYVHRQMLCDRAPAESRQRQHPVASIREIK